MPTAAIGITASFTISTKRKRYGQSSSQVAVRGTRNESGPKVLNFSICCNRLHPCMFVCFAQFVSFWCSPIMSNIVYCCLCDIYLTKSKKRPRHRCVTPSKTSVKQYARAVSLFWLVFLSLFCFVCSSVVCRHCVPYYQQYLCSLRSSVWNSIFWLFSDAPSTLTAFQITGLIALKSSRNIPQSN